MVMTAAAPPPATFDDATRQNIVPLSSFAYSAGGTYTFTLPTSGLGARLYLAVTGAATGTPSTTSTGPYSLFKRITVRANSGVVLFDLTGFGAYLLQSTSLGSFDEAAMPVTQGSTSSARQLLFNYSATACNFVLEIPLAWNRRDDIGLVMLQNQRAQVTVQITFDTALGSAFTDPYTGGTSPTFSATVYPYLEFFTLPADPALFPDLQILCSRTENQQAIAASGDQTVTLNRGNTYTKIIHWIYNNGALDTTDLTKGILRYDQNVRPYETNIQTQLMLQALRYQRILPDGVWVWDLEYQGDAGLGYFRDTIDSEAVSELSSIITFNASPTSAVINTVAEQLIHLDMAAAT